MSSREEGQRRDGSGGCCSAFSAPGCSLYSIFRCVCVCVCLIWQRVVCDWYGHESGPVLPGTDWLSFHSGRGQNINACSWLAFSQVSGTATQERRAEATRAEGSASEQLREEEEGERRGELQAVGLGYSSKHRSLSSASLRKLSVASPCPSHLPAAWP